MKKFIIVAAAVALSLPAMADSTTSSSTTTTTSSPGADITTTTTVQPSNQQSMEEAPQPSGELSSPSLAPSTDTAAPLEQREEAEPSFQSAPYEQERMEDISAEEDEEFVPGAQINDVDEEEEY